MSYASDLSPVGDGELRLCRSGCGRTVSTPRAKWCDDCAAERVAASKRRHKARKRANVITLPTRLPCCESWQEHRADMFVVHGRETALARWDDLKHKQCAQHRQWKDFLRPVAPPRITLAGDDFILEGFSIEKRGSVGSRAYCNRLLGDHRRLCNRPEDHQGNCSVMPYPEAEAQAA
jgi:hypothetical protein